MWIFYVDILCGYFMLIFYVDILCGYFICIFYVDILCGYFMWIFYVDILCVLLMYSPKHIGLHGSIFLVVPSQYVILLSRRDIEWTIYRSGPNR